MPPTSAPSRAVAPVAAPVVSDSFGADAASSPGAAGAPAAGFLPDIIRLPRIGALARHATPHVIEGVLLPVLVFYAALAASNIWGAIIAALVWSYLGLARRALGGRRVSGLLLLTALTLSVRFAVAVVSGSTFSYFLQPVIGQVAVAGVFLLSLRGRQPILLRLAGDIVPLETLENRPCVASYFRQITFFWAAVLVLHAAVAAWLLLSLRVEAYVAVKTVLDGAIKVGAIAVSIWWFRRALGNRGISIAYG